MKSVGGTHRLCCIMKLMKMVQFSSSNLVNSSILGYMRRCICLIVLILVSGGFHAFAGEEMHVLQQDLRWEHMCRSGAGFKVEIM